MSGQTSRAVRPSRQAGRQAERARWQRLARLPRVCSRAQLARASSSQPSTEQSDELSRAKKQPRQAAKQAGSVVQQPRLRATTGAPIVIFLQSSARTQARPDHTRASNSHSSSSDWSPF